MDCMLTNPYYINFNKGGVDNNAMAIAENILIFTFVHG